MDKILHYFKVLGFRVGKILHYFKVLGFRVLGFGV